MLRPATIAILIVYCSACSRAEFAYRNADWLLKYYTWKTLQTSTAQRKRWEPLLQSTLREHREQQLPVVIAYLDLAARMISIADDPVDTTCLVDGALLLYQQHARLAAELTAPLLAELDTDQIGHLSKFMSERQQEAVKDYLNPDPQLRKTAREERIIERIETWTGKLDGSQRHMVYQALERIPDMSASWLEYRAQRNDMLLSLLETGTDTAALRKYLEDWWVHRDGATAATRQHWQLARHEFIQLLEKLAVSLTGKQRVKLGNRVGDIRRELASFMPPLVEPVILQDVHACTPIYDSP
jgi:hypothetical protein